MLVSLSWMKKYVDISVETKTLVEDLTMAGINVERVVETEAVDSKIVVGKVLEVHSHPDADKLVLCRVRVDAGEPREIVCGAPNVARDQYVPVALPGARLPDGNKIKVNKIRGVRSDGMICSERELGLGNDAAGILVLEGTYEIGTPLADVLMPPDTVLEIEVTPNRPDLLSHAGVAREIAALYNVPVRLPETTNDPGDAREKAGFEVQIANAEDCARYVGLRVDGIRVGPSPAWLSHALAAVGVNSINNVVDVTNYVMLEFGQPLHAFDFERLKGSRIEVRRAEDGEKLLALDEKEYDLSEQMLVIADERRPVALAGVIGGEESAVGDSTRDILIESAHFHPVLVRKTRKSLNLVTEASYRFERGVDRELCRRAALRAAEMIAELCGGRIAGLVDNYPSRFGPRTITVRRDRVQRLLGAALSREDISSLLERLGMRTETGAEQTLLVGIPSARIDLEHEIDLIEEVARLYGYDRIGSGWKFRCTTFARPDAFDRFKEVLAERLGARGFSEVIASSFTDGRELEIFDWAAGDPRRRPIRVRNPLNANQRFLRTSLLPGMLDVVRRNLDYSIRRIQIYQLGRVFLSPDGTAKLPDERSMLGLVITKPNTVDFWYDSKQTVDLFDIKKEVEILLAAFRVDSRNDLCYVFDDVTGTFSYSKDDRWLVEGGIVPARVAEAYDFDQPIWYATFDLTRCYQLGAPMARARTLAEYPASRRDLSLVASEETRYEEIEKSLVKNAGRLLESLQVFDVYRGKNIPEGRTAYGLRLSFRSMDRTLRDDEVDQIVDRVLVKLKNELGVELRS